jgi:hypothetical protein
MNSRDCGTDQSGRDCKFTRKEFARIEIRATEEFARWQNSRDGGILLRIQDGKARCQFREIAIHEISFAKWLNLRWCLIHFGKFAKRYSGDCGIRETADFVRKPEFARRRNSRDGRIDLNRFARWRNSLEGGSHTRWRNSQDSISRDGGIRFMEFARWRVSRGGRSSLAEFARWLSSHEGEIREMAEFA